MAITVADLVAASSPGMGSFPTSPRKSAPVKPRREVDGKAVRKKLQATRDSQHRMLDELGIDPWSLYDDAGEVDTRRVDQVHAEIRERLKAAGVDVPENAGLSQYSKLYAGLDDAGKKKYKEYTKQVGDAGTGTGPGTGTGNGATLANGQKQAPGGGKPGGGKPGGAGPAPLNPREIVATADVSTRNLGGGDAVSDTQVDGLSDRNQTDVVSHLTGAARNKAAVLDIQANDARKDARQASKVNDEIRRRQSIRGAAEREENGKKYWQDRADRLKAERAERNYKNRIVNSASDWENLGRLRGNELDGKVLSDEDYNKTVAKLKQRAVDLRGEKGVGLSLADSKDMDGLFKAIGKVTVDEKTGVVTHGNGKKFTPAQIEALEKRISGFESHARESRARTAAQVAAFNRSAANSYREQYGLQGFSDEDVLAFHKKRQGQAVGQALDTLAKLGTPRDAASVEAFESAWDVLRRNADLTGAFNRAIADKDAKARYMDESANIQGEDAGMRREALRRLTILDQLNKERASDSPAATAPNVIGATVDFSGAGAGAASPTGDSSTKPPDGEAPPLAPRPAEPVAVPTAAEGKSLSDSLARQPAPQQPAPVEPRKKKPDEQAAMLYAGGYTPIKPRTRR